MLARNSNLIEMMASNIPGKEWGITVVGKGVSSSSNQNLLDGIQGYLESKGFQIDESLIAIKKDGFTETVTKHVSIDSYSSLNISDDSLRPPMVSINGINSVIYAADRGMLKLELAISRMNENGYDVELESHTPLLMRQFQIDEVVLFGCSAFRVNNKESGIIVRMEQLECSVFIPYIPNISDLNFAFYLRVVPGHVRPYAPWDVAVWAVRNRYGLDTLTLEEQGLVNGYKWRLIHKPELGVYFFETSYPNSIVDVSDELRAGLTLSNWYKQILDKASKMAGAKLETIVARIDSSQVTFPELAVTHQYQVRNPNEMYIPGISGVSPFWNWSQFSNDLRGFIDTDPDLSIKPYNKIQYRVDSSRLMGPLVRRLGVYVEDYYLEETTNYMGYRF
ncbi:MAG: hypothetical protein ACRDBG_02970, partial [Waterburya sp.]